MGVTTTPYILDTDTVTHQQAGQTAVLRRLSAVASDAVFTTVITVREQLRGRLAAVDQATEGPDLLLAYDRLLATVRYFAHVNVLPFSPAAAATLQRLRDQRIRIGTQDLRIAAIVLANGGTLVTSNRRDFAKVPELLIEDWSH
jgi:tRNA(fMet)-specific endonuclease VapC